MAVTDVQADVQRLVLAGSGSAARQATHVLLEVTRRSLARAPVPRASRVARRRVPPRLERRALGRRRQPGTARQRDDRIHRARAGRTGRGSDRPGHVPARVPPGPARPKCNRSVTSAPMHPTELARSLPRRPVRCTSCSSSGRRLVATTGPRSSTVCAPRERGSACWQHTTARSATRTGTVRIRRREEPAVDPRRPPCEDKPPKDVDVVPLGEFVLGHSTQFGDSFAAGGSRDEAPRRSASATTAASPPCV